MSVEYRRIGNLGGGWPGSFSDVIDGITLALERDNLGYDNTNVAIVGHSAGGHLTLLAGAALQSRPSIKSVIGLAAITDIEEYSLGDNSCQKAVHKFMGGTATELPEHYRDANPTLKSLHPKSFLIQAGADAIVGPDQSIKSVDHMMIPGAGHFDMIHPHTSSFQALLNRLQKEL